MDKFIIFYGDRTKVCGKTQAEWDSSPKDNVIGVSRWNVNGFVGNIVGADWYCRGEKDGEILYPYDTPQINRSLSRLFPAIKNGDHSSDASMTWMNNEISKIISGECGCGT